MIIEDVITFLKNVPPFQFLDETVLRVVATNLSMEFFPKNTVILSQDGPPSDSLRIIKKGGVKVFVRSDNGEEMLIDYRGEGDTFGFLSLIGKDKQRSTVVALDDTICYLLSKEKVISLLDTNPIFTEYFLKSHFSKYIHKTYSEMRNKGLFYDGSDKLLFTTPVGELATKEVITASQDLTIREAAEIMSANGISSLILTDSAGAPVGIVTDRDLRDKVVAKGRSVEDQISRIMSVSLIRAKARDYCFEALMKMIRYNIHHLLVVDSGKLKGVVTNHDLMMLQGTSPISLVRDIESQQTIEGLIPESKRIDKIVELLIKEGAKASNITRIITEINDRLVRKVLEITEKILGSPPLDYCWIVYGSEGRKEQTFKTDQDNAIIYADPDTVDKAEAAKTYFTAFTLLVRDSLLKCGFPVCPADYLASNPQWCQPLKTWKRYFSHWIHEPTSDAVLKSLIFFDFRPLHGALGLSEDLRDSLISMVEGQKLFLGYMANSIIKNMPPLGFFRSFVVEKGGEHKDEFDLKIKGIAPLIDAIRLFAIEKGIRETSTLERIQVLKGIHSIVEEYGDELEHAFEFLMLLRIHHQFDEMMSGKEPDNFINPNELNNLEKRIVKEAFLLVEKMQGLIIERYKAMMI
jgi:CBS domain-containing protein